MSAATCAFSRSLARRRVSTSRASSRAGAVVAEERRRAVVAVAERGGLGDVVQQRAEAQREAAVDLVGERLGEQRRDGRGVGRPDAEHRGRVGLERDRLLEHLERVGVDVGVVVAVLLDAAQRVQLGQDRRGQPDVRP